MSAKANKQKGGLKPLFFVSGKSFMHCEVLKGMLYYFYPLTVRSVCPSVHGDGVQQWVDMEPGEEFDWFCRC